jgi:protein TonB
MKRKWTFTLFHGFVASISIHALLGAPFIASVVAAPPEEPPLVIELQGVADDSLDIAEVKPSDIEQKRGDTREARPAMPSQDARPQQTTPSDEQPMDIAAGEEATHNLPQPAPTRPAKTIEAPPPAPEMKAAPDDNNIKGANEYVPPTRKLVQVQITEDEWARLVEKKIRVNLHVPEAVNRAYRRGVTTVSFVVLTDGRIGPDTLKVVKSSGYAMIDRSALDIVRASAPFAQPPQEITYQISIAIAPER